MKDIKFVPVAPKTYEVRYLEVKEPSNLSRLAGYLGIKTVENCVVKPTFRTYTVNENGKTVTYATATSASSSSETTHVSSTKSTQAEVVSSAIKTTSEVKGKVDIKTNADGSTDIKYDSEK